LVRQKGRGRSKSQTLTRAAETKLDGHASSRPTTATKWMNALHRQLEGRAPLRPLALGTWPRQSVALQMFWKHARNLLETRAQSFANMRTIFCQNARNFCQHARKRRAISAVGYQRGLRPQPNGSDAPLVRPEARRSRRRQPAEPEVAATETTARKSAAPLQSRYRSLPLSSQWQSSSPTHGRSCAAGRNGSAGCPVVGTIGPWRPIFPMRASRKTRRRESVLSCVPWRMTSLLRLLLAPGSPRPNRSIIAVDDHLGQACG